MDKNYFPHASDGSVNPTYTFPIGYNLVPLNAVAVDPRNIISEWTEASLKSMHEADIYVGQQVYCLNDKTVRVCRYIPNASKYSAYDCIWDITYNPDNTNNWIDVSTYTPAETVEEKIEKSKETEWQLNINSKCGYWGFYNFDTTAPLEIYNFLLDEDNLNAVMANIIMNQGKTYVLTDSLSSIKMNAGDKKVITSKDASAYINAKEKVLIIFIPDYKNVTMTKLNINDIADLESDLQVFDGSLKCMSSVSGNYDIEEVGYKAYAYTQSVFNDNALTISYTMAKNA